jgi:hypothetical protein
LNISQTIAEIFELAASSFRLCAEQQFIKLILASGAGLLVAGCIFFLSVKWVILFNRNYTMTRTQTAATAMAALAAGFLLPLWLALGFAHDAIKVGVRQRLNEISTNSLVMHDMRTHMQISLAQTSPQLDMATANPSGPDAGEKWRFATSPNDASILTTAKAYTDALAEAMTLKGRLLSRFLSWKVAPGFLAADIRMHATTKPQESYDLNPASEALSEVLTEGLAARVKVLELTVKAASLLMILTLTTAAFLWLALSAYRDIRVYWPSSV